MKKLCSISLDYSRDRSNKNCFALAATYFEEKVHTIKRVVYELIEQNKTSAADALKSVDTLFQSDFIKYENVISITTDNAYDMIAQNGLVGKMKLKNPNIYSLGCVCHKLNLILKYILEWTNQKLEVEELDIPPIEKFIYTRALRILLFNIFFYHFLLNY